MLANLRRLTLLLFALACGGGVPFRSTFAQESKADGSDKKQSSFGEESKDGQKVEDKKFDIPYWDRSESFQIRAAVAVIGEANTLGVVGARMAISESVPTVAGWEFFFESVLPINRNYLDVIRDNRPLPDLRAKELIDLKVPDRGLYLAYLQALRRSHSATLEMFQRSAEETEKVHYTHLAADPKLYRGKVVTVKGSLKAIRAVEAPPLVQADGILEIYTSWIIGPTKGAPPFAIVFTQLPKELNVSERLDAEVTFHGYFLSNILIPADKDRGNTKKDLYCPWLIGKTLIVASEKRALVEPSAESSGSVEVVLYTFGVILGLGILIGLLNYYFRRTDQSTQSRIAELRDKHQPFSIEDGDTGKEMPSGEKADDDWTKRIGN